MYMRAFSRYLPFLLLCVGFFNCAGQDPVGAPADAGTSDGGSNTRDGGDSGSGGTNADAGTSDGGSNSRDGGDSGSGGTNADAGVSDGGSNSRDGGDSGSGGTNADAGVPAIRPIPCDRSYTPFTDPDYQSVTSAKAPFCQATLAGLKIRFVAPVAPTRLAVYLHGDSALEWRGDNGYYLVPLARWAYDNNMLFVAPLAPFGQNTSAPCGINDVEGADYPCWWANPDQSPPRLAALLKEVASRYNLSTDNIAMAGLSGGSIMISREWLHRFGDQFPGRYVMNCGGDSFDTNYPAWNNFEAAGPFKDKFDLLYNYGSEDFLAATIANSVALYRNVVKFKVTEKVTPGAMHCATQIETTKSTITFWEQSLKP